MQPKIQGFGGEFHFLSNFYPCKVEYMGLVYPSSEHAYQAAKVMCIEEKKKVAKLKTAAEAKKFGKTLDVRFDWHEIKLEVMSNIVRNKFNQNERLAEMLLITENAILEETNWWGDRYWGVCRGKGENHLGKILMQVREELKNDAKKFSRNN